MIGVSGADINSAIKITLTSTYKVSVDLKLVIEYIKLYMFVLLFIVYNICATFTCVRVEMRK